MSYLVESDDVAHTHFHSVLTPFKEAYSMNGALRRVEFFANIAIIAIAFLVGVAIVKGNFFYAPKSGSDSAIEAYVSAGKQISLPDIDWAKNGQTILLVLSKGCHFCSESASFYQRLAQETSQRTCVRLIALFPNNTDEGKKYLSDLGIPVNDVKQMQFGSIKVKGTPTIMLVDNAGIVRDVWAGKLPAEKESEVLSRLGTENTCN